MEGGVEFDVLEDFGMDFMCWNGGICGGFSSAIWGFDDCGNFGERSGGV
ncbi:hypothetical protein SDJN02_24281, partial [Cucurbita argyrosperma subsp. argyrosperma]